jgi:hypothetical protein
MEKRFAMMMMGIMFVVGMMVMFGLMMMFGQHMMIMGHNLEGSDHLQTLYHYASYDHALHDQASHDHGFYFGDGDQFALPHHRYHYKLTHQRLTHV